MFQDLYRDTYRQILEIVNRYEMSKGHNREVTAYLAFLTFAVLDDQAASLIPVRPDEFMYHRLRLYAGLSRSDLLNNWHCPDIPDMNDNPLFTAFIAFGDLLINSSARKDYRSASLAIHDLSETVLFATSMIKQVLPKTTCQGLFTSISTFIFLFFAKRNTPDGNVPVGCVQDAIVCAQFRTAA